MIRHLAVTAAVALAACGSAASTTEPTEPTEPSTTVPRVEFDLPADPDAVVLQLTVGVNQPDPIAIASGYPIFTLYADGRLVVRDRTVRSGALAPLAMARLSEQGVRELLAAAIAHGGLDPLDSYGWPNVADDDSLGFVVATADRRSEFGVYGLGSEGDPADEITPEELEGRRALRRLRDALVGWKATVGEHVVQSPAPYTGETVLAVAVDELDAVALDLPADLTGGAFYENRVDDVYCVELSLVEWPDLVDALVAARSSGTWVTFRQVLPHEPGCAIVTEQ